MKENYVFTEIVILHNQMYMSKIFIFYFNFNVNRLKNSFNKRTGKNESIGETIGYKRLS